MSKLSFRARALDAAKPMPIFKAEELPDLPEYSAINRAVPQMPSGMEKEEECVSFHKKNDLGSVVGKPSCLRRFTLDPRDGVSVAEQINYDLYLKIINF